MTRNPLQTQRFTPEIDDAFGELNYLMARLIREITFANLNSGVIDPKTAKAAADRSIQRATKAYRQVLEATDETNQARTLARLLAELTVSATEVWVTATHAAITGRMPSTEIIDDSEEMGEPAGSVEPTETEQAEQ